MEHPSNFGYACEKHAPKPDPGWLKFPDKWFVGKTCKLGFPTETETIRLEHMWVDCVGIQDHEGKFYLAGVLNNDPVHATNWKCGDVLLFERNEIEAVYYDEEPRTPAYFL